MKRFSLFLFVFALLLALVPAVKADDKEDAATAIAAALADLKKSGNQYDLAEMTFSGYKSSYDALKAKDADAKAKMTEMDYADFTAALNSADNISTGTKNLQSAAFLAQGFGIGEATNAEVSYVGEMFKQAIAEANLASEYAAGANLSSTVAIQGMNVGQGYLDSAQALITKYGL